MQWYSVVQVVMDFAVSVPRGSTIVIIGNVAEYHEACLYARKKGLFVERILSADGLHRLAEACHANWMSSLASFLTANGMKGAGSRNPTLQCCILTWPVAGNQFVCIVVCN